MKNLYLLLLFITNLVFGQISPVVPQFAGTNETESVAVVANPNISMSPYVLCGGTSTVTLSASPTNAAYTYQWSFSATENGTYTSIAGGTSATFTTNPSYNVCYFKVAINDGTAPATSPAAQVRQGAVGTMISATPSSISAGGNTTLNMTFTGTGPWYYTISSTDGYFNKDYVSTSNSASVTVLPQRSVYFQINSFFDSNGIGCNSGLQQVTVNPTPSFTLDTSPTTSVCAGSIFDVPITYNGTWGNTNSIYIRTKLTTTAGATISGSEQYYMNGSPLKYVIPPGTPTGTYKISSISEYPVTGTVLSSYNVSVVNTGCTNQANINMFNTGCSVYLYSYPQGSGFTYQWYKDNVAISGATSSNYYPISSSQNGSYTVTITNTSLGFSATSTPKIVIQNGGYKSITSTSTNLCNPVTLTSDYIGSGYTYQWFKTVSGTNYQASKVALNGETSSTLAVTNPGTYYLKIWNGNCQVQSNDMAITICPPIITSTNPVICGTNAQATLTTSSTGAYQWSFSSTQYGTYTNISGATSSSYATSTLGFYKVTVDGTASNAFGVTALPTATLTNSAGNNNTVNINPGQTENLKVSFTGIGPWSFTLSLGIGTKSYTTSDNPFTIPESPTQTRNYSIYGLQTSCGNGTTTGNVVVNVLPTPTLSFVPNQANLTVCKGSTVDIPYNSANISATDRDLYIQLATTTGGYISANAYLSGISNVNSIPFWIPTTVATGTYKVRLGGNVPYLISILSDFTVTVTDAIAGCPAPTAMITGSTNSCGGSNLNAYPNGSGYTYQWKKEGVDIAGATYSSYYATLSGAYSVVITNTSLSYTATAASVSILRGVIPTVTTNDFICGTNASATLTSSLTGAGYTYQWYSTNSSYVTTPIIGATSSSYVATSNAFTYSVKVTDATCQYSSNTFTLPTARTATLTNASFNNNSVNINAGESTNLKVTYNGSGPVELWLLGGGKFIKYIANSSPFTIPVSPAFSSSYSLVTLIYNNCEVNLNTIGSVVVNVGTPILTLGTPPNLTVCAGSSLEIPFTKSGNWPANSQYNAYLTTIGGGYVSNATNINFNESPLNYFIPPTVPVGQYKLNVQSNYPYLLLPASSFIIDVVTNNVSCPTPIASIADRTTSCNIGSLYAYPSGSGFTYQWFKDNTAISSSSSNYFSTTESGNFKVRIINIVTGYDETTPLKAVTVNYPRFQIASPNSVLCGTNTSATLSTSFTGAGYIYQWYKLRYHGQYYTQQAPIYGATSSTYTATSVGEYYVLVWDGTCQFTSDAYLVTDKPQAKLMNAALTNTAVDIAAGQSTDLKVSFGGVGPWNFSYYDGINTSSLGNISANPYTLTVTPALSKRYSLVSVENSCGVGSVSGSLQVNVGNPSFVPTVPANTSTSQNPKDPNSTQTSSITVCAGSTVLLPYTITGTWSSKRNMTVELYNAAGNYVSGSNQSGLTTNPIQYFVPNSVATGTYSIKMYSKEPYIEAGVFSTYTIDVGGSSCTVPLATINAQTNCTNASLNATPTGSGYTFQWYKNGVMIPDATFNYYSAKTNGNYTVNVAKAATSYNATSTAYPVVLTEFNSLITASSGQICEGAGSLTFTSANTGVGFTHQWYYSSTDFGFAAISGATNATYTATQPGFYFVIIKNGDCEAKSNVLNTCTASVNFVSKTVCTNSAVIVPFTFSGGDNQSITIQLINAITSAVVVADLKTLLSSSATNYNPTVNIPNSVATGDYKFKIVSGSPSNVSRVSNGILSISSQAAGVAPTITRSVNSITSPQNVNIAATGCSGTVNWTTPDAYLSPIYPEFTWYVSQTNTFSATCTDLTSGCTSPSGSATVTFSCTDIYEPNNTYQTSTTIASNAFTSPVICLDGSTNADWFTWTNGAHIYYIKASLAWITSNAGNYEIKLTYDNTNLTIETIPETIGQSLDTYLTLFDSDGVTILGSDDNGNANGFSKIIYGLITISPCVSALTLNNPTDDISTGNITKDANATTGTITATNKITGNANVTYRAGKSITLDVGFKADQGVVFKTEFGGCN